MELQVKVFDSKIFRAVRITIIILFYSLYTNAQISINYFIRDNTILRQDDMWNFMVLNASGDVTCLLTIDLMNKDGDVVIHGNSPQFTLKNGSNTNFTALKDQTSFTYGQNEEAQNLKKNGILLTGRYHICLKIIPSDNVIHYSEKCIDFRSKEFYVLRLVYPLNNGEVLSPQPLLKWNASSSSPATTYALKLTILNDGQTKNEALESNPSYVNEINLSNNVLQYPFSAPGLESKKNYVWQVAAIRNQEIVATTEPWIFHLVNLDTIALVKSDCYRLIHKTSNNEFYVNDDILRFGYENIANDKILDYQIINLENNKIYRGKAQIQLTYGLNKIDIKLKNENRIKKNTRHLLRIHDSDNNTYSLIFNSINEAW
jgi:hypothetical protein